MNFKVRNVRASDMPFVVNSWLYSFRGSAAVAGCDHLHYKTEMTRAIRRLCGRAVVLVATAPDDDDHLLGFAAFSKGEKAEDGAELHYVYIKGDFRKMGIARALLKDVDIKSYTFLPATGRPRRDWAYKPRFTL